MKSPRFAYVRARSVTEALDLLAQHGPDARILAGGQSLLPMLAFRMSSPTVLIDIGGIRELRFIEERDGVVRIGALTRHVDLESSDVVARRLPLIARAMPEIAHPAIRNRGTIGGSLALADPAAQLPACVLALEAQIVTAGPEGERRIDAGGFFTGTYETALQSDELLTCVEISIPPPRTQVHFSQLSRRHGDFAIAGLAATSRSGTGATSDLRLVYLGCGDRPLRAQKTEALLRATPARPRRDQIVAALRQDLQPPSDLQATSDMRLVLAAVLAERGLAEFSAERAPA
jgi:carbon-monoxide dehydrogenase medium subunit